MKRILITAAAVVAGVSMTYAQGTVSFSNIGGQAVVNSLTGANVVTGSSFRAALYYAAESAADPIGDLVGGVQQGAAANFGPLAGFFSGGNRTAPTATAGGVGSFQVRAWETAYGATYEAALAAPAQGGRQALVGRSNIVRVDTGDPTVTPPGTPGSLVGSGLLAFQLTPVPEPSVVGLGLLGAGALLLLRRRK